MKIVFAMLLALVASSCSQAVPAGHVGILVEKYGGDKGVQQTVKTPGYYWLGWNEDMFIFPTFQQNYTWTASAHEGKTHDESFSFQTQDGMTVNADVGISYHLLTDKIPAVFQKYRKGIEEITDTQVRNVLRDALNAVSSTMAVTDIYGPRKEELLTKVKAKLLADGTLDGIIIDNVYFVGTMRLPEGIVAALNAKIEATQKAQQRENEVAEARAQAAKEVAQAEGQAKAMLTRAEAEAKSNQLKLKTLTAELIRYEAIQKWDGAGPQVMIGSGTGAIIDVSKILNETNKR